METLRDGRGLAVSTRSAHALQRVEAALASLLGTRGDVAIHVEAALRVDPDCVIAGCIQVSAMLLGLERSGAPAIARALGRIDRLESRANARERSHVAALRAWAGGDAQAALDLYACLLLDHPRDSLALHLAHALDFRLGQRAMLRERVARVLPHWHAGVPHFGYVLAMYAFGLEEAGDYVRAEALARRSLEIVPGHAAAMHVVAHVLEMQGRAHEGIAWLESTRPVWSANAGFAAHLAWHLALFHLDRGEIGAALAIHDATLRPSAATATAALVDASALLWRLELRGASVGSRWNALAGAWQHRSLRGRRAFDITHAVMAFAGARRHRSARRATELLRRDPATRSASAPRHLELSIAVCEALQAFGQEDYALAVERIAAVRTLAEQCGGSIAQCDVINLTFLEAALRGRRSQLARALAAERSARKPRSLLNRWLFARAGAAESAS